MSRKCVALEWGMTEQMGKDYVPCDEFGAEPCILEGIMLAVDVDLCREHQKYFADQPKGWGLVKLFDKATGKRIEFMPYRGRVLMAEKLQREVILG